MKSAETTTLTPPDSLLILGPPGVGKTTLVAALFDGVYFLNADNNINGPIRYLETAGHKPNFLYDDIIHCESIEELKKCGCPDSAIPAGARQDSLISVPREWRFRRLCQLLDENVPNPAVKAVALDSLTSISDMAMDEVRRNEGLSLGRIGSSKTLDANLQRQHWGGLFGLLKNLIFHLKAYGKPLIVTGHVKTDKDESTGSINSFIAVPGQMKDIIAGYFQECWLLETETKATPSGTELKRYIRTVSPTPATRQLGLKTSCQLGSRIEIDFTQLKQKLK